MSPVPKIEAQRLEIAKAINKARMVVRGYVTGTRSEHAETIVVVEELSKLLEPLVDRKMVWVPSTLDTAVKGTVIRTARGSLLFGVERGVDPHRKFLWMSMDGLEVEYTSEEVSNLFGEVEIVFDPTIYQ